MLKFYANINGTNEGPYTLDELKDLVASNKISPKTYVLLEGTDKCFLPRQVEGLFPSNGAMPNLPPLVSGEISNIRNDFANLKQMIVNQD